MEKESATGKSTKTTRSSASKGKKTTAKSTAKTTETKTTDAKSTKAKSTAKSRSGKKSSTEAIGVTQQQRQDMIREMAYLLAERRGFCNGNPTDDWLAAESQVDTQLLSQVSQD